MQRRAVVNKIRHRPSPHQVRRPAGGRLFTCNAYGVERLIEQPLPLTVGIVRFACKDPLQSRKVTGGGGGPAKKRRTMGSNCASARVG